VALYKRIDAGRQASAVILSSPADRRAHGDMNQSYIGRMLPFEGQT